MFWRLFAVAALVCLVAAAATGVLVVQRQTYQLRQVRGLLRDALDQLDRLSASVGRLQLRVAGLSYRAQRLELSLDMLRQKGRYLVIDRHKGRFWVREGDKVLLEGECGVGRGRTRLAGRIYNFETPAGRFKVLQKLENPWWYRPDWFWKERGLRVPKRFIEYPKGITFEEAVAFYNSLSREDKLRVRAVPGYLGKYAIKIADGIYIHYSGRHRGRVSHGCIRVSKEDAEAIYRLLSVGDPVYIY